ncbi:hypothetical protein WG907_05305 [Sphingobium sp. AN558]|uniref:hypothetical protein n=1 Tax=Sphingobium sp. AN558 TaxID=3133442 RepID=UPI0030BEB192
MLKFIAAAATALYLHARVSRAEKRCIRFEAARQVGDMLKGRRYDDLPANEADYDALVEQRSKALRAA